MRQRNDTCNKGNKEVAALAATYPHGFYPLLYIWIESETHDVFFSR